MKIQVGKTFTSVFGNVSKGTGFVCSRIVLFESGSLLETNNSFRVEAFKSPSSVCHIQVRMEIQAFIFQSEGGREVLKNTRRSIVRGTVQIVFSLMRRYNAYCN